ncbi:PREDICTED: DNA (cytosine-5)-methyltransferase DRM1-like isoform X1 [Camelina sativa]|uniref:DNA (cytosine-5-)-methyltransferase n=1 Tax=Camelina sativa TaxID=90675 RepID=A0ABM1QCH0_CAMSA|nr:PREDICTED: DNA (cytosine-5)-methyltransferase DRM1-like isoform X1 [Camelina sativa]XP_019084458.1 PREDICTED: DNA (cytosine-5)-methyltransferase DRM1-like isoform X1 [Camelina sativa]
MVEHSGGDVSDEIWNSDDEFEIDNYQSSPMHSMSETSGGPAGVEHSGGDEIWNSDEFEIDNYQSSPVHSMSETSGGTAGTTSPDFIQKGISDETFGSFIEMGFSSEMIVRAIEETGGANWEPTLILETLFQFSTSDEPSSSKSKVINHLIGMGFTEENVLKAIQEYGDENIDELTYALLTYAEVEKMSETKDENINTNDDDNLYTLSSDDEGKLNYSNEDSILQDLIKMDYSREEAAKAIERCGKDASVEEVVDFICAAQMARQFDEFFAEQDKKELITKSKKRRVYNEPPRRERKPNTATANDELIRLPNPMIGFGVPNEPGLMKHRPVPIPDVARGPPYFYYENVAMAPKGVWAKISSHLYDVMPEFVDSKYFCAAARKRGYVHNLPIHNRYQIQPPPHYTIQEAFPLTKRWWPTWDKRLKLNCLVTCIASAQLTNRLREKLERHDGEPPESVQKEVLASCRKWNLVWVGTNKLAPLEADEMEKLLGFPIDHTRGGGISRTDRFKSLGNSFQVDTVAYHLSVLKPLFPNGINVLSLFTGIGGGEVALHRLKIQMNVVVSVEISDVNRNILSDFWKQTNQTGILREFSDVTKLDNHTIERLMDEYGGFDLVIGGSPCNNLAGGNRISRVGLEGDHSSLFFEYCRILETVRSKTADMRRR